MAVGLVKEPVYVVLWVYEAEVFFEGLGVTPDAGDDLLDEVWRPVSAVEVESRVLEDLG